MSLHKRLTTQLSRKMATALWVTTENVPLCVTRCLFGNTRLRASRLDCYVFSDNSNDIFSLGRP